MALDKTHDATHKSNKKLKDYADVVSDVLFFSIGEGAIVLDERGNIARVNKVALDILGYEAKELLGKWYPQTIIAEEENGQKIPNLERPVTEVFLTGRPVFRKFYYRRKDGSRVPVALTVSPIIIEDRPMGAIGLFRDITEESQLENAKDEFISIASHQLRTPATVVKQYLSMVIEGLVESEDQKMEMLLTAYTHNNIQLDIINDLLKVAQFEANKFSANYQDIDLVKLAAKMVSDHKAEFDKRSIKLTFKSNKKVANVCIDPLHIQMVLDNLVNNANKYSQPDTTVTVEIEDSATACFVRVHDQGMGIAAHDISKLFTKFSRVKSTVSVIGGTGLGLYWAKKLIELYDGEIQVVSKLHKGSTFSVLISKKKT